MNKPSVFFSHSSKDKDIILSIKKKIDLATNGAIDIFMSSDGQSIPFGTNWVHSIEDGLKATTIMFVFITENSISSGWIYFEAGYANSKGINVIPIGIGIDIGSINPPLNLLQGFNIDSEDSLNNFITLINNAFDYHIPNVFHHDDYLDILSALSSDNSNTHLLETIMQCADYNLHEKKEELNSVIQTDVFQVFKDITHYLESNNISFSQNNPRNDIILTCGIKIHYYQTSRYGGQMLEFSLSPINFSKTFPLLIKLLSCDKSHEKAHLCFYLNNNYHFLTSMEACSSILANYPEFSSVHSQLGYYIYNESDLSFTIQRYNTPYGRNEIEYIAVVVFDKKTVNVENILTLFNRLYDIGLIYKDN